jgi:hypothetical protein
MIQNPAKENKPSDGVAKVFRSENNKTRHGTLMFVYYIIGMSH